LLYLSRSKVALSSLSEDVIILPDSAPRSSKSSGGNIISGSVQLITSDKCGVDAGSLIKRTHKHKEQWLGG